MNSLVTSFTLFRKKGPLIADLRAALSHVHGQILFNEHIQQDLAMTALLQFCLGMLQCQALNDGALGNGSPIEDVSEKLATIRQALLNLVTKHKLLSLEEPWKNYTETISKIQSLSTMLQNTSGHLDDEPVVEALYTLLLTLHDEILTLLQEKFWSSFRSSNLYEQLCAELLSSNLASEDSLTPLSVPNESANDRSTKDAFDVNAQMLRLRSIPLHLFDMWQNDEAEEHVFSSAASLLGSNKKRLALVKRETIFPFLSQPPTLVDLLSTKRGINVWRLFMQKVGSTGLFQERGTDEFHLWLSIESFQDWINLHGSKAPIIDESVLRREAETHLYLPYFSRGAPRALKLDPSLHNEVIHYLRNDSTPEGPFHFDCFLRVQREMLIRMVKRFWMRFLETEEGLYFIKNGALADDNEIKTEVKIYAAARPVGQWDSLGHFISQVETEEKSEEQMRAKLYVQQFLDDVLFQ